jgi:hypothetical protein
LFGLGIGALSALDQRAQIMGRDGSHPAAPFVFHATRRRRILSRTDTPDISIPTIQDITAAYSLTLNSNAGMLVTRQSLFAIPPRPASESKNGRNGATSAPTVTRVMGKKPQARRLREKSFGKNLWEKILWNARDQTPQGLTGRGRLPRRHSTSRSPPLAAEEP